jgi:hypothetical protein
MSAGGQCGSVRTGPALIPPGQVAARALPRSSCTSDDIMRRMLKSPALSVTINLNLLQEDQKTFRSQTKPNRRETAPPRGRSSEGRSGSTRTHARAGSRSPATPADPSSIPLAPDAADLANAPATPADPSSPASDPADVMRKVLATWADASSMPREPDLPEPSTPAPSASKAE